MYGGAAVKAKPRIFQVLAEITLNDFLDSYQSCLGAILPLGGLKRAQY